MPSSNPGNFWVAGGPTGGRDDEHHDAKQERASTRDITCAVVHASTSVAEAWAAEAAELARDLSKALHDAVLLRRVEEANMQPCLTRLLRRLEEAKCLAGWRGDALRLSPRPDQSFSGTGPIRGSKAVGEDAHGDDGSGCASNDRGAVFPRQLPFTSRQAQTDLRPSANQDQLWARDAGADEEVDEILANAATEANTEAGQLSGFCGG